MSTSPPVPSTPHLHPSRFLSRTSENLPFSAIHFLQVAYSSNTCTLRSPMSRWQGGGVGWRHLFFVPFSFFGLQSASCNFAGDTLFSSLFHLFPAIIPTHTAINNAHNVFPLPPALPPPINLSTHIHIHKSPMPTIHRLTRGRHRMLHNYTTTTTHHTRIHNNTARWYHWCEDGNGGRTMETKRIHWRSRNERRCEKTNDSRRLPPGNC